MTKNKVFGIGFQKTGTTTLGVIFDKLGYRTASYHQFRRFAHLDQISLADVGAEVLKVAEDYDAAKDTPWPLFYQSLDQRFPNSKFIHVTRDPDAWISSAVNDFSDHPNALHHVIYGSAYPKGNEAAWLERYARHNREVLAYFADRPDDFLSLRLEDGVSYEKVCDFLNEPRVGSGVPQANTRLKKRLKMAWWRLTGAS